MSLENLVDALRNKLNTLQTQVYGDRDHNDIDDIIDEHGDVFTRLERLEAENDQLRDEIATLQTQTDGILDLGSEKTSKEQKLAALIRFAMNQATSPREDSVMLSIEDMKGAAGISRRYCYKLIGDLPDDYDWAHDRKDADQYGDMEIDSDAQAAGLIIDLETVHNDPKTVNKFITENGDTEAPA